MAETIEISLLDLDFAARPPPASIAWATTHASGPETLAITAVTDSRVARQLFGSRL